MSPAAAEAARVAACINAVTDLSPPVIGVVYEKTFTSHTGVVLQRYIGQTFALIDSLAHVTRLGGTSNNKEMDATKHLYHLDPSMFAGPQLSRITDILIWSNAFDLCLSLTPSPAEPSRSLARLILRKLEQRNITSARAIGSLANGRNECSGGVPFEACAELVLEMPARLMYDPLSSRLTPTDAPAPLRVWRAKDSAHAAILGEATELASKKRAYATAFSTSDPLENARRAAVACGFDDGLDDNGSRSYLPASASILAPKLAALFPSMASIQKPTIKTIAAHMNLILNPAGYRFCFGLPVRRRTNTATRKYECSIERLAV
jgi:hypothetical protein